MQIYSFYTINKPYPKDFFTIFVSCIHETMMKKFIYMIILAAVATACSEGIALNPAMSLYSNKPEVLDETAIFRLAVINMPDSTERRFPVTFGGTAERGVDYEVSSDAFVFGGKNPVDSIVVTTLKFDTGKTVSLSIEVPEGIESGHHLSSGFTLQETPAFITFSQNYRIMTDSTYVKFGLADKEGNTKVLRMDTEISVSVDTEKSTAVEGVDFEFADSSHFTIKAGSEEGELKIKKLKAKPESGKDKIVLSLSHADKYGEGAVRELEISLLDTLWSRLDGKWKIDTLVTDTTYMMNFWGDKCTGYELFPEYEERDVVTFYMDKCIFTPSFSSDFKLYFIGNSDLRVGSAMNLDLGEGRSAELQTFVLDNTNRDFSKESVSEDKESLIGARIIEGLEEAPDTLDFYVIDYVSKSFMPQLDTLGLYAAEKPVAAAPGLFLNITFVK